MKRLLYITAMALAAATTATAAEAPARDNISVEAAADVRVRPVAGGVEVYVASDQVHDVTVYAITGQVVKQVKVADGTTTIDLPAGCYIVRIDRQSTRVVVR